MQAHKVTGRAQPGLPETTTPKNCLHLFLDDAMWELLVEVGHVLGKKHLLTDTPGFSSVMSRDRFGQIMRYLHVNDEALGNPDNDKLYKVRRRDANGKKDVPLSTRVVRQLVVSIENLNHHLYVDNFYTSPALFRWLKDRHIYACDTVRKGRLGFPKELYFGCGRHERGTADYLSCECLLAQSWFDSKGVYFLSTIHTANYSEETPAADRTVRHRSAAGAIDVATPPLLCDYNCYMGGVVPRL
ncbi:hypothetical protein LSH36_231g03018 [Paralvinella palmiformis]|uniref:PiggyBac transposable element-derived protein domain-containing protein n=1 Tax=Paralvinella palmiformis TaxID=53620 RepID=A0AAD9JN59_9ANNE|nr:hypothetical protein LSH36_231g03018 [Paralvinella palmiformis]